MLDLDLFLNKPQLSDGFPFDTPPTEDEEYRRRTRRWTQEEHHTTLLYTYTGRKLPSPHRFQGLHSMTN